jgi:hypothetical protein
MRFDSLSWQITLALNLFIYTADQAMASFTTLNESLKRIETLLDKRCRVLDHEATGKGKKDVIKTLLERM